jgi:hypothetical protein
MMLRFETTHQDSLSPARVFEANSSEAYNSEMKTLSVISSMVLRYIEYCMLLESGS